MASPRESTKRFKSPKGSQKAVLGRTSVYELFRQHAPVLAGLPGEVSQFNETGFGYEWRCEYQLDTPTSAGESPRDLRLQLHFSLMDLKNRRKPAAVLYLVEQDLDGDIRERHLLPLEDLGDAQEAINASLAYRPVSIGMLEKADRFIQELQRVREALGDQVNWVSSPD